MVNKEGIKEFLKPNRKKIIFFCVFILLPFYGYTIIPSGIYLSNPLEAWTISITLSYIISCFIVKKLEKFAFFRFVYLFLIGLFIFLSLNIVFIIINAIHYPFKNEPFINEILRTRGIACANLIIEKGESCEGENVTNTIFVNLDANRDGLIDSGDTLQTLCENYFGCGPNNTTCCKKVCDCLIDK